MNEKLPFIKFPADFEIKLTNNFSESSPLHFLVKKEGAPNNVSVIVWAGYSGKDIPEWEIMTDTQDNDSLLRVSLDDTKGLIKAIEETFYYKYEPDEREFDVSDDSQK